MKSIGVLALQGAFQEHIDAFELLRGVDCENFECRLVKRVSDMDGIDALVISGGESTAMATLAGPALFDAIRKRIGVMPIWGTCAGLILLADRITTKTQTPSSTTTTTITTTTPHIGGLPITVSRNWYGSQVNSFIGKLNIYALTESGGFSSTGIFIRAPRIVEMNSDSLTVLATLPYGNEEHPVAICHERSSILATTFHPELDPVNLGWHRLFLKSFVNLKME